MPDRHMIEAELCKRDLSIYTKKMWPLVEPGHPYLHNWHIDLIAEHLMAAAEFQLRKIIINIPFRSMKSVLCGVAWPTWVWTKYPERRFMFSSNVDTISTRDALRSRRVIESEWYQKRWGHMFNMAGDQNQKTRYENNQTGYRIASSVGASIIGEGADYLVLDDPHKTEGSESSDIRKDKITWFKEEFQTRRNNPEKSATIIVMQRVAEDDISGHLLAEGWADAHVCIPMRYESKRKIFVPPLIADPRTVEGELMWLERFPEPIVQEFEKLLGPFGTAGQLQQRPFTSEGLIFQPEKIKIVDVLPSGLRAARGWDLAATEAAAGRTPDWTAGGKIGVDAEGRYFIMGMVRLQGSAGTVEKAITNTASQDGNNTQISIPQDPGQAGKAQALYYTKQLAGYNVHTSPESGDKITRAEPFACQVEAGNVYMLRGEWNTPLLDEMRAFPKGNNDDQVDALSRAFAAVVGNAPEGMSIMQFMREQYGVKMAELAPKQVAA